MYHSDRRLDASSGRGSGLINRVTPLPLCINQSKNPQTTARSYEESVAPDDDE
jgi:hypothetical protein